VRKFEQHDPVAVALAEKRNPALGNEVHDLLADAHLATEAELERNLEAVELGLEFRQVALDRRQVVS